MGLYSHSKLILSICLYYESLEDNNPTKPPSPINTNKLKGHSFFGMRAIWLAAPPLTGHKVSMLSPPLELQKQLLYSENGMA